MIVMIYCHATKLYLPILYILLQGKFFSFIIAFNLLFNLQTKKIILIGKEYDIYFEAISFAVRSCDHRLRGLSATCDFEQPLMKAVKDHFGDECVLLVADSLETGN